MDTLDSVFRGGAVMIMVLAFWSTFKLFGALWRWLRRDAARSIGRASGVVVSTGRKLGGEFREGFKDKA